MNSRRLLRNSIFMTGSVVAGGVLLFAIFVIIARYLSAGRFGQFVFVLTLANLFQLFTDGGIVNVTIRDLARNVEARARIFGSTRALVWVLTVIMAGVIVAGTALWNPDPEVRVATWYMGAAALVALHGLIYAAVARAFDDMGMVALASILHKVVLLLLVLGAIALDAGLEGVALVHVIANLLLWAFFATLVRRRYFKAPMHVDLAQWRELVRAALPLGVGQMLRRMTTHLGTFLLAALAGVVAVGLYNSAYRVVQMMEIGAAAATGVLLPVFARLAKSDPAKLQRLYGDSLRMMLVLSAPIAGLLMTFGDDLVLVIYGAGYAEAGSALRVLGASLFFMMPSAVMHGLLAAIDRQAAFMKLAGFGVVSSAIIGVLMIPTYGSLGAAWATLVTEALLFVAAASYLAMCNQRTGYVGMYLRVFAVTGIVSGLGLWAGAGLKSTPSLALACVLYLLVYAVLIVLGRVITPNELAVIRDAARPQRRAA